MCISLKKWELPNATMIIVITDSTGTKKVIRKYYEQFYEHKLEEGRRKGHEGTLRMVDTFVFMIMLMVLQMYTYIKTYQIIDFKYEVYCR